MTRPRTRKRCPECDERHTHELTLGGLVCLGCGWWTRLDAPAAPAPRMTVGEVRGSARVGINGDRCRVTVGPERGDSRLRFVHVAHADATGRARGVRVQASSGMFLANVLASIVEVYGEPATWPETFAAPAVSDDEIRAGFEVAS